MIISSFLDDVNSLDCKNHLTWINIRGSKGGAVVRALASHQCGPGSNPGVDAICGLSLLLVLSFCPLLRLIGLFSIKYCLMSA